MDERQRREKAIQKYEGGESPKVIYIDLKRSESWFFKWLKRYREGGDDWAQDLSCRPHHVPHKVNKGMEEAVIDIRKHLESQRYTQIGALNISWHLKKKGLATPSFSTINRILKRNNLVHKKQPYEPKGVDYPHVEILCSNHLHQFDIVGPRFLKNDGRFYSANIIDAYDRRCSVNPERRKNRIAVTKALINCWQTLGIPSYLQMDNILTARGSNRYPHSFGLVIRLCLTLGIQPLFIPLNEPWRNGIIEHFQNVFDKMLFRSQVFQGFSHFCEEAKIFELFHNQNHRYSTLNGKTPVEKFSGKGRCLARDFKLPRTLAIADGYVHIVRFIRSNRILDIFGEKFVMPSEVEYEYVWAIIDIKNEKLKVYHDSNLIKELDYSLPKTALDLSEFDL